MVEYAYLYSAYGIISYTIGVTWFSRNFNPKKSLADLNFLQILNNKVAVLVLLASSILCNIWSVQYGYFGLLSVDTPTGNTSAAILFAIAQFVLYIYINSWIRYLGDDKRQQFWLILALFTGLILITIGLFSISKGGMLVPFIAFAIVYSLILKRYPLLAFSAAFLIFNYVALPLISYLRSIIFNHTSRDNLTLFIIESIFSLEWISKGASDIDAGESIGRGLLNNLSQVIYQISSDHAFLNGQTLINGFYALLPSFIFPEKPINSTNWVAQFFGAVETWDFTTNLAFTVIGEFYMNFGIPGVVLGMIFFGFLASFIDLFITGKSINFLKILLILNLGWNESFIGQTFLPFAKTLSVNFLLMYILNRIYNKKHK